MRHLMVALMAGIALALYASPAATNPVDVESINGPQDPLWVQGPVEELGNFFPPDELIESLWQPTDETAS